MKMESIYSLIQPKHNELFSKIETNMWIKLFLFIRSSRHEKNKFMNVLPDDFKFTYRLDDNNFYEEMNNVFMEMKCKMKIEKLNLDF